MNACYTEHEMRARLVLVVVTLVVSAGAACLPDGDLGPVERNVVDGELTYVQLGLGGVGIGESAILVGPDGTTVLIDTGNDSHADVVEQALVELVGQGPDHVVITHFHADHGAAIDQIARGGARSIVTRGAVDIDSANVDVLADLEEAIGAETHEHRALCVDADGDGRADSCPGIGSEIELGEGARLRFVAVNARTRTRSFGSLSDDDEDRENAKSIAMIVEHGEFRMWLAGDLTGGGSDTDDVEALYAEALVDEGELDPVAGVDVLHAGHHGRDTSTSSALVAVALPDDDQALAGGRVAIMGISFAHLGSPHAAVLDALSHVDVFTTRVTAGGALAPNVTNADGGNVVVRTVDGGARFVVEAVTKDGEILDGAVRDAQ